MTTILYLLWWKRDFTFARFRSWWFDHDENSEHLPTLLTVMRLISRMAMSSVRLSKTKHSTFRRCFRTEAYRYAGRNWQLWFKRVCQWLWNSYLLDLAVEECDTILLGVGMWIPSEVERLDMFDCCGFCLCLIVLWWRPCLKRVCRGTKMSAGVLPWTLSLRNCLYIYCIVLYICLTVPPFSEKSTVYLCVCR